MRELYEMGNAAVLQTAAILMALAAIFLLLLLFPNLLLIGGRRPKRGDRAGREAEAQNSRQAAIRAQRFMILLAGTVILTLILKFGLAYNWGLSVMLAALLVNLVAPLVFQSQDKQRQRRGRREALVIADYVAGRINAKATLIRALENILAEHNARRRNLALSAPMLDETIRATQLGRDLADQLDTLGIQFYDIPELSGLWRNLAVMQRAGLGAGANLEQAEDLSLSLRQMDSLKDTLETELSTSTMTRMVMMLLMGGFTGFLIFFYGDDIGSVLTETTPGNILLGFSLLTLYLSQIVGNQIEKMPLIRL